MPLELREDHVLGCCASPLFAQRLAACSPFKDADEAFEAARRIWWGDLPVTEWLAAFAAHPKIGDSVKAGKPQEFATHSSQEQAAAAQSSTAEVAEELKRWNAQYLAKFGFIFIIFAKGRSSQEILAHLKERCNRLPYEELQMAAREQMKITEIRLAALLGQPAGESELQQRTQRRADQVLNQLAVAHTSTPLRSPITTHVLDSARGVPAGGLPLALMKRDEHSLLWETLSGGVTNEDGRVGNLLPPSNYLQPGRYRIHFDTAAYLRACKQSHPTFYADVPFYPEVSVDFEITEAIATDHYHIALLLSPYGYSTYKGS